MKLKRMCLEVATTIPIGAYIGGYPFFKLMKKSKNLSERWYGFVFSIVYIWGEKPIREMKELLFKDLAETKSSIPELRSLGAVRVLEIGPGFGGNFKFYPPNTQLTTIEINDYLEKNFGKIKEMYPNITLERSIIGNAENMKEVPDNSVDVVVGTLILCCIDDPMAALREIHRVLVPGGKFYFLENVHHPPETVKYKLQKVYKPFWKGFTLRCKAGAFDAMTEVEQVGFDVHGLKSRVLKELPFLLSRFQYGVAVKKLNEVAIETEEATNITYPSLPDQNGN